MFWPVNALRKQFNIIQGQYQIFEYETLLINNILPLKSTKVGFFFFGMVDIGDSILIRCFLF